MARGGFFAVDSLTSVHVLVVDDDPVFRDVLLSLLRYCGALVTAVATAEEALLAMNQVKPDALVITIGGGDRAAAAALPANVRKRKPEDGGHIPIVAVLRAGQDQAPESVNAHLAEPLNPWELCRVISTLLATG
jgi:CheY-like chemotaxis protein